MKKIIILFAFILVSNNGFGQKKGRFKPGVKLVENIVVSEIDSTSSILFIFEGHTHLINFYLDLTENLSGQFKEVNKKIDFNYNLTAPNSLEADINSIPKEKFKPINYDLICLIKQSDINSWDNHKIDKRKQNYNLILELKKRDNNQIIETAILNVNSYYTIATQNRNSSKFIYELITQ